MKTVGIIGGLGPETTAKFYLEVIDLTRKRDGKQRPPMLIWNVPMEVAIEKSFIAGNDESQAYIKLLTEAAQKLEAAGVDFIVIPCNSVHVFIDEIRQSVKIPVLSIVEETVTFLKNHNIDHVAVLATSATVNNGLYDHLLEPAGISVISPSETEQRLLDQSITRLVNGENTVEDRDQLNEIITSLANQGVQTTLLACTDLQLITPSHPTVAIYDTMQILVESTVNKIFES